MRALAAALVLLAGCDLLRSSGEADAGAGDGGYPPPRTDLVPPVGGPDTLDLGAWNIENMPKSDWTVRDAADVIASLDLDVVVVEEVASVEAWDELVARLPDHEGVLSPHRYTATSYQKIGLLYRADLVTATEPELLFVDHASAFPRPPILVHLTTTSGWTVDVVGVHLKAGTAPEDVARRADAVELLDAWARAQIDAGGEDEIVILGDWNATLDANRDDLTQVWPPLLGAPDRYTIRTAAAAARDETSFIPTGVILDHIVTPAGLADDVGAHDAVIPDLEAAVPAYERDVSDHLPVTLSFPLP